MSDPTKEKPPDTEGYWKVQDLKAGAALKGRKAQTETERASALARMQAKAPEIYRIIDSEGTLTPSAKLGVLRRVESAQLMHLEDQSRSGYQALLPMMTSQIEMIGKLIRDTAAALGEQDLNIVYLVMPNEEEKRIDDLILGGGK